MATKPLKVFRVIVATEDVMTPESAAPFSGVQHVVYVVTPSKRAIPDVLASDPVLRHLRDVPRVMEEIVVGPGESLWQVKLGPSTSAECLFTVVKVRGASDAEVEAELRKFYKGAPGILELVEMGWFKVAPRPIDLTTVGVW